MCGIAGVVEPRGEGERHRRRVEAMQGALAHRGPDGRGVYVGPGAALAHTRLAIRDPEGGFQPLISPDGRWVLLFNGDLHEAEKLRHAFGKEFPFSSDGDTEAVLATLVLEGERGLHRLNGMFALALWDTHERRLLLARDRLGVKPLWFEPFGGELRFGSEIKALLAARERPPALDPLALAEWATVPAFSGVERAPFEGIRPLPPGHLLEFDSHGLRLRRWGGFRPLRREVPEGVLLDDVGRQLWMAISSTADHEERIGQLLSGGLDSTLIASVSQYEADEKPLAFTVRHEGQEQFDYGQSAITFGEDLPFARAVAEEFELELQEVLIPRASLAEDLRELARLDDTLPAWEQQRTQHHLMRAAAEYVKVVLVGDGADETHYGYGFLLDDAASGSLDALLSRLRAPERAALLHPRHREGEGSLTAQSARLGRLVEEAGRGWDGSWRGNRLAVTELVVQRWLPRLLQNGDLHAMAHGIEARVPFADVHMLDFAERLAPELSLRDGLEKWHLRQVQILDLPESVRTRRKSALPKDLGAGEGYRSEATRLLRAPSLTVEHWLDVAHLRAVAASPGPLDEVARAKLFQAICFVHWVEQRGL